MEVERTAAGLLGVEVHLPGLAQRVRLDEVALVVHVEPVLDGVVLQVGDEAGDVEHRHERGPFPVRSSWGCRGGDPVPPACHDRRRVRRYGPGVDATAVLEVLDDAADAVRRRLAGVADWGLAGTQVRAVPQRPGRRRRRAGGAGRGRVRGAQRGVGPHRRRPPGHGGARPARRFHQRVAGHPLVRHRACARWTREGPLAAVVVNLPGRRRFTAVRGGGARTSTARPIQPTAAATSCRRPIIGLSGFPPRYLGWKQYRALGAAALDLCAVAAGTLDGYLDCTRDAHGVWDYAGGLLVCQEAGARVVDAHGPRPAGARPRGPPHPGRRGHARAAGRAGRGPGGRSA